MKRGGRTATFAVIVIIFLVFLTGFMSWKVKHKSPQLTENQVAEIRHEQRIKEDELHFKADYQQVTNAHYEHKVVDGK
ncbi:hypothetical protein [Fangia hongkongensis]|uniref:hypothetical protein n=1 Tax=Fangia hongkongensis TaxID=270495 RepID=UPI00036B2161|nr:hypothetical protein [Fangia hongkongensis]MBK2125857.1 hypothetical protein [Fangia hongkongensis]